MIFSSNRQILFKQIDRNMERRHLDNAIIHSHRMLEQIKTFTKNRKIKILSVGSCNALEIYAFKSYGYDNIIGIDLVRPEKDRRLIKSTGMHNLKFKDDSFDLIFCSGTFHCSYNPQKLAEEFIRVVKNDGMICITVPIEFEPTEVYRVDAKSLDGLYNLFLPYVKEKLWSETVPPDTECNPHRHKIIRCIFTIKK
ncbi:MAG: class I SAM-dependent methyltransferase [Patescibacteria group bacterium]|nr:methyltransferase domain-containing protein [Patescibacteria group bacterium]MDE2218329.1 class I SAM-dependent methyltransferase [Patescibacteria group bacterium]